MSSTHNGRSLLKPCGPETKQHNNNTIMSLMPAMQPWILERITQHSQKQ